MGSHMYECIRVYYTITEVRLIYLTLAYINIRDEGLDVVIVKKY